MRIHRNLQRPATLVCFAISLSLSAYADSSENLRNFQKVNDHLYRGAQPTAAGFKDLAQRGIKTVIDLRSIGEHSQADEEKIVTELGMRYISIPMHGFSTPDGAQMATIQALLVDAANGPVFVHCKRGADRTGAVVAAYRISHDGWENKKALHEAKSLGMSPFERAIQHYVSTYKAEFSDKVAGSSAPHAVSGVELAGELSAR